MSTGPFGLVDEDFWRAPYATKDAVLDRLSAEEFRGVVIDAPERIPLGAARSFPLVGVHRATSSEARGERFDERAVVVAVRLDDDRVFADLLATPRVEDDADREGGAPADDDDDDDDAVFATPFCADLCERLGLPLRRSTVLTTVLLGPRRSNRVRTSIEHDPGSWVDPEAERLREEAAAATWPAPVAPPPGDPLPSYRRRVECPPLSTGAGVGLRALQRRVALGPEAALVVHGSFRVPVANRHLVRPKPDDPTWDPGDPAARAIVPVTLVAVGASPEAPGPFVLRLEVPCHEAPAGAPPTATGYFSLDLLTGPLRHRTPQRYALHAFVGELQAEPLELELVAPAARRRSP